MNILHNHRDSWGFRGEGEVAIVDFARELRRIHDVLRRAELRQVGPVDPEYARTVFAAVAPCIDLEHRHGVCPFGELHPNRMEAFANSAVANFYEAITAQLAGEAGAAVLNPTYIAAGTSTDATTDGMDQLVTEVWRGEWSDRYLATPTKAAFMFFLSNDAANDYFLHEWAAVAGDATSTPGTGYIISRWLWDHAKDNLHTLTGDYRLQRI